MQSLFDTRGIPVCHITIDDTGKSFLLDDETAGAFSRGDYPTEHQQVQFDMELAVYRASGKSGCRLSLLTPEQREALRATLRRLFS